MEKLNNLGWYNICLRDPSKSYIIGASEEANERFREDLKSLKYQPGMKMEDCFSPETLAIINDPRQKEWTASIERITSENYNDIMKVKGMPGNCFGNSYGYTVRDRIFNMMEEYYDENLTREEVMQKVKNICMDMRVYLVQDRYTNGYNDEDNLQILRDVYELVQKANAQSAVGASLKKGNELADQFEDADFYDWMYYDADDYYKSEEMRECIRQAIREMADQWEIAAPDFEEVENNSKLVLNGKLDYNSIWQWHAWQRDVTRMTDLNTAPPEGFSFFYKSRKSPQCEQGYVEVTYQGKKWKAEVPFNNFDANKDIVQFFSMGDFAKKYLIGCADTGCIDFLKKFEIFQKAYMRNDSKWWEML